MVNKSVEEGIMEAKDILDKVEQIGDVAYNICDGILSNLKVFVHDDKIMDEINGFEAKVIKQYNIKKKEFVEKLKAKDPLYQWQDGLKCYMELRQWKSMEMLSFWDRLSKRNEI